MPPLPPRASRGRAWRGWATQPEDDPRRPGLAQGEDGARWRALALLSLAELLAMSVWFTASALGPELQARWGLAGSQVGWLTTSVQLGFVAGTAAAALLNLADLLPSRAYFAATAFLAGAANALLLLAPGSGGPCSPVSSPGSSWRECIRRP